MNDIEIHNDVLNSSYSDFLQEFFLDRESFPWYYMPSTAYPISYSKKAQKEYFGGTNRNALAQQEKDNLEWSHSFSNVLFRREEQPKPEYDLVWPAIMQIIERAEGWDHYRIEESMIRVRVGLATRTPMPHINTPHVDFESYDHRTLVYYVIDSDGPTIIYKQKHGRNNLDEDYALNHKEFDTVFEAPPNKNSFVVFDGERYHSSNTPVNHKERVAITINYLK